MMIMMMMQQVDPLSNHEILETIFKSLDVPSLKAVRLVSPLWKEVALDSWRKAAVLVLTTPHRHDDNEGGGNRLTLSEFQEMIRADDDGEGEEVDQQHARLMKLGSKPFSQYKLVKWNFDFDRQGSEELGFFRDHGSLMEYLHLDHCDFSTFSGFKNLLTRRLPNLRKLVWSLNTATVPFNPRRFSDPYIMDAGRRSVFDAEHAMKTIFKPLEEEHSSEENYFQRSLKVLEICCSEEKVAWSCVTWTRLFYSIPAVEDVTLRMHKSQTIGDPSIGFNRILMPPLVMALQFVARLHGGSKIRKLDIMDFYLGASRVFGGDFSFEQPTDKIFDLPLMEELSLDWGTSSGEKYCKKVLEHICDSLQVLKAFRAPKYGTLDLLPLPGLMDSLRELYLYGNVTENLTFLRYTPKLQVLVMNQFCFEQRHKLEGGGILDERRYVRFCATDLVSNTETALLRFKISEPSLVVTSLEYFDVDYPVVDPAAVATLARWLPNVKTLKMVMDNNEILSATCKAWPKLEKIECHFGSKVNDGGISSVVQCSELRKFKMNSLCGQATLTSSSVGQFLKIGSLRELDIPTSDQVSKEAEATLLEKLRSVSLIRNDHNNLVEYECCQRTPFLQKMFGLVRPPPKAKQSGEVPVIAGPLAPRTLRSGRIVRP